ncbi:MAG: LysR family transcriptional regulator [Neisseriaceae bacterium]|nr:LysR family transcriptional regulator [Neisseriaceae bacterium]
MKLQQLRYALEVYKQGLNVSEAAEVLFTSQPGISKQIRLLEEEIGVAIFVRQGKRLIGVTQPGEMVLNIADRILRDTQNIKKIGDEFAKKDSGKLTIAAIHSWGKYQCPNIFTSFIQYFPQVKISLKTGNLEQVRFLLENNDADLGIVATHNIDDNELHFLPFDALKYQLIIRQNHPLANKEKITLTDLIHYPILCEEGLCDENTPFQKTFTEMGIDSPDILMTSPDTDIIYQSVQQKLGIGITTHLLNIQNNEMCVKDLSHLFTPIPLYIVLKNNQYLHGYMYHFIEKIAPQFNKQKLQQLLYQPMVEDYSI